MRIWKADGTRTRTLITRHERDMRRVMASSKAMNGEIETVSILQPGSRLASLISLILGQQANRWL